MATAMIVGAFCAPCRARALNMNPIKRLPQSPRKMVAGLKLKRRKPRIEPASARAISETRDEPETSATANTTIVEKRADPAARPSSPSMRLKALVMARTQRTVSGKAYKPGKMVSAKKYRQVEDAQPTRKQHSPRYCLNRDLHVRADVNECRHKRRARRSGSRAAELSSRVLKESPKLTAK